MEGLEDFLANQEKVVKSVRLHEEPDLEYREIFSDNSQEIYGLDYDGTGVLVRFTKSTAKNDILGEYKDFIRYKKLDSKHFMIESGQGTFPEKCMNGYKTKDIYAYISGELITSMEIQFVGTKNEWGYKSIVMPFRELGVYLDDDCFLEKPELASELPPDKYKGQLYVKTGNNYTIVDEDVSSSALILEDADLQKNLNQDEKFYFHLGGKEFILEED